MVNAMTVLKIDERGLLIPPRMLTGLPSAVTVRPVEGGILIESVTRTATRKRLAAMVETLRATASPPTQGEVTALVGEVRARRAHHR